MAVARSRTGAMEGGRLALGDPHRISLGLLPSGSDPVGEGHVHHQPSTATYLALATKLQAIAGNFMLALFYPCKQCKSGEFSGV